MKRADSRESLSSINPRVKHYSVIVTEIGKEKENHNGGLLSLHKIRVPSS